MKEHKVIRQLVIRKIEFCKEIALPPTAQALYEAVKREPNRPDVGSFKSFVKIINAFPEIEGDRKAKGMPMVYKKI